MHLLIPDIAALQLYFSPPKYFFYINTFNKKNINKIINTTAIPDTTTIVITKFSILRILFCMPSKNTKYIFD